MCYNHPGMFLYRTTRRNPRETLRALLREPQPFHPTPELVLRHGKDPEQGLKGLKGLKQGLKQGLNWPSPKAKSAGLQL